MLFRSNSMPSQQLSAAAVHPHNAKNLVKTRKAIDAVVFLPEPLHLHQAKQKNLRLTQNRKYLVFEKRPAPNGGELFVIQDDLGREQIVSDIYFVPGNINLVADRELNFSETKEEKDGGNLYWGNAATEPGMPDLRRR